MRYIHNINILNEIKLNIRNYFQLLIDFRRHLSLHDDQKSLKKFRLHAGRN